MTRTELLAKLGRSLNKHSTLDSATETRLLDHLNNRHREILSWPGAALLRHRTLTFSSVVDQARYGLANVEELLALRDTENDRTLARSSLASYRRRNPDPAATTGTPHQWVPLGYQPVALFPSDASALAVKSTSASDTQTAYVEGWITGGYPRSASVALTGTTAVSVSASISTWIGVSKFYLSSAAVGVVTLHEDAGSGTELARIGIGQLQQRYYALELDPTPSEALTYYADVLLAITDLAQATDEPLIPHDFHDALYWGAMVDELIKTDDERLMIANARWKERTNDLKLRLAQLATDTAPMTGFSRLGPWTPAGV